MGNRIAGLKKKKKKSRGVMYSSGDGLLLHVFHHTRRWGGGRDDFLASDASDSNQKLGQKQNGCSVKTERKMEMERNVTLLRYKPGGETTPPVFSTPSGSASSLSANRWAQSIGRSALSGRQRHDKERGKKKKVLKLTQGEYVTRG